MSCQGGKRTCACGPASVKELVRDHYAEAVRNPSTSCCSSCGPRLYGEGETAAIHDAAVNASFGCGNPTALATLLPGESVLDLGSGAGLDALLAANRVGPTGRVSGIDMTADMLEAARDNAERTGCGNVEFTAGEIESLPYPDESFDVVISNCVINLSPDKAAVLSEAARVLKPGGRFAVTDVLLNRPLPETMRDDPELWAGCVAGALLAGDCREMLAQAGLTAIDIEELYDYGLAHGVEAGMIASAFIRARKPGPAPDYEIRAAREQDTDAITHLLGISGLPSAGLDRAGLLLVADAGAVIASVGVELYGDDALLRSVAVAPGFRDWGVGKSMVQAILERLPGLGVKRVYLLTESADEWFLRQGFVTVGREPVPDGVRSSGQFTSCCPASAHCLRYDVR